MLSKYPEMLRRFNFRKVYWFREGVLWWCLIILGFQIFCLFVCLITLFIWWLHTFPLRLIFCFYFFPLSSPWVHTVGMASGEDIETLVMTGMESRSLSWTWQREFQLLMREYGRDTRQPPLEKVAVEWSVCFQWLRTNLKQTFPGSWGKTVSSLVYRTQSRKQAILGYRYRRVDTGNSRKRVIKRAKQ